MKRKRRQQEPDDGLDPFERARLRNLGILPDGKKHKKKKTKPPKEKRGWFRRREKKKPQPASAKLEGKTFRRKTAEGDLPATVLSEPKPSTAALEHEAVLEQMQQKATSAVRGVLEDPDFVPEHITESWAILVESGACDSDQVVEAMRSYATHEALSSDNLVDDVEGDRVLNEDGRVYRKMSIGGYVQRYNRYIDEIRAANATEE